MSDEEEIREIYRKYGNAFVKLQESDRNRAYLSSLLHELIGNVKSKRVLDAGCGAGYESKVLLKNGAEVVGIDLSEHMIELAKKRCKKGKFFVCDMEKTGFPDESFDLILAVFSLCYKRNLRETLTEFYRVLKTNGKLFIVEVHPIRKMIKYTGNYFESGKHWEIFPELKRFGYYRKVEDYLNLAIKVGFKLEVMREVGQRYGRERNFPSYLILKFGKI